MARQTLNATVIAALQNPETGQKIVWDDKLKGFGVRLALLHYPVLRRDYPFPR